MNVHMEILDVMPMVDMPFVTGVAGLSKVVQLVQHVMLRTTVLIYTLVVTGQSSERDTFSNYDC